MSSALTITEVPAKSALANIRMSSAEITARRNALYEIMKNAMIEGLDYGTIPGTPKPCLYKPGAEKLLSMFMLSAHPVVEDLSDEDTVRYRVRVIIKNVSTGQVVGEGIGEASSSEDKYKWRKMVCQQEFDETPADRRRKKWKNGNNGPYQVSQVRAEKEDISNTILKMAKKRGQIDGILTVTAASDVFSQDEDALEKLGVEAIGAEGEAFITKEESTVWTDAVKAAGIPTQTARAFLRNGLGIETSLQMKKHQLDKANVWLKEEIERAANKKEPAKEQPAHTQAAATPAAPAQTAPPATAQSQTMEPIQTTLGTVSANLELWAAVADAFDVLGTPPLTQKQLQEEYRNNPQGLKDLLDKQVDEETTKQ